MDNHHCHGMTAQFAHGDAEPMEVDDDHFIGTGLADAVGPQIPGVGGGWYDGRGQASTIQGLQHKDIPDHWWKMELGTVSVLVHTMHNVQVILMQILGHIMNNNLSQSTGAYYY